MSPRKRSKKPLSSKVTARFPELARKRGERELIRRFLVVCEDGKSAVNYFLALRSFLRLSPQSLVIKGSEDHTQPIQVVTRAVELMVGAAAETSATEPFDQVWCVIDGDFGSKINNARVKATAKGVRLAVSTKCFEYWVLLHFEEYDKASLDCGSLVSTLRAKHIPDYAKGSCDFQKIVESVREAARRAKKLR
ncbi:RloB family protein, partial [Aquisphaera insulae]|uniref:RloB family protein n=1 Tax=Aquisphaera insulae TaxID=2712864 RepID=UPI0013EC8BFD